MSSNSRFNLNHSREYLSRPTEDIYNELIKRGNGGVRVRSTTAPALATQFVQSSSKNRATSETSGALAQIIVPSLEEVEGRLRAKHPNEELFGYTTTAASDVMGSGYGERSARALAREESTFQLKGVFPSAALSYAKLRARVEARDGDADSVDTIFAALWGLPRECLTELPRLHLSGSEPTRMAAMEDRAYHSLAAHPSINGGFRVDLASITQDALGSDVPINWPRVRTALKAIAVVQTQGDLEHQMLMYTHAKVKSASLFMDFVVDSQPTYSRPLPWELIVRRLVEKVVVTSSHQEESGSLVEASFQMAAGWTDEQVAQIVDHPDHQVVHQIREIASIVSEESNRSFQKTVEIILAYDRDRAELKELDEDGVADLEESEMSEAFEVPRYKVKRMSLFRGLKEERLGASGLPDVDYHGRPRTILDMDELREAKLTIPLDIGGILNLAVYLTVSRPEVKQKAYHLMALTTQKFREQPHHSNRQVALRSQKFYEDDSFRALGKYLFGEAFRETVELLIRNVATLDYRSSQSLKAEMWRYLNGRTVPRRPCPVLGDWRDLLEYLHVAPEGWTLYYWARKTIGRQHSTISTGIFAPIATGQEVDLLTAIRKGVEERKRSWAAVYATRHQALTKVMVEEREKRKEAKEREERATEERGYARYIPPSLRAVADFEARYGDGQTRVGGFTKEEYERMVEAQAKSKFFSQLQVYTKERRVIVGMSDTLMTETLVEFYQARWYRTQKRLEAAQAKGTPLRIGPNKYLEHPWGELNTDLPRTPGDMLEFMRGLDARIWTVEPMHLYNKLKKSIFEFWDDISKEIALIVRNIEELYDDIAEDQEEAIAGSSSTDVVWATHGTEAIPLQVQSYRAPYQMPARTITIDRGDPSKPGYEPKYMSVETKLDTFLDDGLEDAPVVDDLSMDLADCDYESMSFDMDDVGDLEVVETRTALSLDDVWRILGLPEASDDMKKFAIGTTKEYNLQAPHLEAMYGPVLMRGEEAMVQRRWRLKVSGIMSRLGRGQAVEVVDDMEMGA